MNSPIKVRFSTIIVVVLGHMFAAGFSDADEYPCTPPTELPVSINGEQCFIGKWQVGPESDVDPSIRDSHIKPDSTFRIRYEKDGLYRVSNRTYSYRIKGLYKVCSDPDVGDYELVQIKTGMHRCEHRIQITHSTCGQTNHPGDEKMNLYLHVTDSSQDCGDHAQDPNGGVHFGTAHTHDK